MKSSASDVQCLTTSNVVYFGRNAPVKDYLGDVRAAIRRVDHDASERIDCVNNCTAHIATNGHETVLARFTYNAAITANHDCVNCH